MNTVEPFQTTTASTGAGVPVSLSLGLLVLLYLLYDHFEKRLTIQNAMHQETESRFHVTEDKLATLEELQEEIQRLKESEEERKSSWEDDVTEPNKYQAILGVGRYESYKADIEIRLTRKKLNSFKSNRYWLLNNETNLEIIKNFWEKHIETNTKGWMERDGKLYCSVDIITGIDELCCIEVSMTKIYEIYNTNKIVDFIEMLTRDLKPSNNSPSAFKWKHSLLTVSDL
jgi:hypothetical protein